MTASELFATLQSPHPPTLLHVLPEDVFSHRRLPGSKNACVYEIAFLEKAAALVPEKSSPVITYGAGHGGCEAAVAAEKLREAGWSNVAAFDGGLAEWTDAGFPLEGDGVPDTAPLSGTFQVNTAESLIRWTGRNLFNHHHGTVRFESGVLTVRDNVLTEARFAVDVRSIQCDDIPDEGLRATLVRHLLHSDFFLADKYPLATFEADQATAVPEATEGTPNFHVSGRATVRGTTRPLAFDTLVAAAPGGQRLTAQAQFEVDRTEFGSIYGSGKFFRCLGQHLVNDHFHLHVKIHADRTL